MVISAVRAINLGGYILVYQDISTWIYPGRLGYIQVDKSQLLGYIHVDISQSTRIYPPRYILVYQAIQVDLSQSTRIYLRGYILVDQDISTWINPSLLGYIQVDKSKYPGSRTALLLKRRDRPFKSLHYKIGSISFFVTMSRNFQVKMAFF